jgi:thiamine biosynthesis lipoprotein
MSRESRADRRRTVSFRSMGVDVVVSGATPAAAASVRRLFESWDATFSRFRPDSELSRVNAFPGEVVVLSPVFAQALVAALEAAAATDGLVDPTLGRAIAAAGYDRDFELLRPDRRPLGETEPGRWRELRLCGRLLARPPGLLLDLNGVVKGLVADETLRLLPGDGFVAAGGDLAARGGLVVGLPHGGAVTVTSGGVATSGTSARRWFRGGREQHHLLDAATGRPARSRWTCVSVAAGSCVVADVAAKAAFLLSDDGPDWLDERGLLGRFVGDGEAVVNRAWRDAAAHAEAAA